MAATVEHLPTASGRSESVWGRRRVWTYKATLDNSYATGGEAVTLDGVVDISNCAIFIQQRAPLTGGYNFVLDRTNSKLLVFWVDTTVDGAAMSEVASTTDLSAVVVDIIVIGG